MKSIVKSLNCKPKTILFYICYVTAISVLLLTGIAGNIHAATFNGRQQFRQQNRPALVKQIQQTSRQNNNNWFRDGLNNRNFQARSWVAWHESRNHWRILSYGHRCIGYFQLDPRYLGRKNGHVNLDHQHQVKVADHYAKVRYGNWVHAKHFWQVHHWY